MAQTWTIPTGSTQHSTAVKTMIPDALEALRTLHSGAVEPASKVAYMLWADTATGWLKQRNAANTAWLQLLPMGVDERREIGPRAMGDVSATVTRFIGRAARAGTALRLLLWSGAASTSSSGNEVRFALTKYAAAGPGSPVQLFSGTVGTFTALPGVGGGAEFVADAALVLAVDQNASLAVDDLLEVTLTYVGAPTATLTDLMASVEME